jgi:hypothetical protein
MPLLMLSPLIFFAARAADYFHDAPMPAIFHHCR